MARPGPPLPVRVSLRPPLIGLQIARGSAAHLAWLPLEPGASVELLIGSRLHLGLPAGQLHARR